MYNANTTLIIKIFSQYKYIILDIFCGPNMKSKHTVTEVLYVRPRIITLLIYFYRSIRLTHWFSLSYSSALQLGLQNC